MEYTAPAAVLILGVKLGKNDEPTEEMKIRVETAAKVFTRFEANGIPCRIIACGGITSGCRISEAEVMERLLVMSGVPREKIIKDEKSRNTMENMRFAAEIADIKKGQRICIVTSDYHSLRAVMTAKHAGFNAYSVKARLKHNIVWFKARLKEPVYTIDLVFGWQDGVKIRPHIMERLIRRLS